MRTMEKISERLEMPERYGILPIIRRPPIRCPSCPQPPTEPEWATIIKDRLTITSYDEGSTTKEVYKVGVVGDLSFALYMDIIDNPEYSGLPTASLFIIQTSYGDYRILINKIISTTLEVTYDTNTFLLEGLKPTNGYVFQSMLDIHIDADFAITGYSIY